MKKYIFISILLILVVFVSYAQNKKTTYYSKDDEKVSTENDHYYYAVISTIEDSEGLYMYSEFYSEDNSPKLTAKLKDPYQTQNKVGECKQFYPNGVLYKKEQYDKQHQIIDTAYTYYSNAVLFTKIFHPTKTDTTPNSIAQKRKEKNAPDSDELEYVLVQDSAANTLVVNGNGLYSNYQIAENNELSEKGSLVNHKKDGLWTGSYNDRSFKETWSNGTLISGVNTNAIGQETIYDSDTYAAFPDYPDGINNFRKRVVRNFNYPNAAIRAKVSGTIYIQYVVEKDGSLNDFQIIEDLGYGTGEAAIEALKNVKKKWIPGFRKGIPVRVPYMIPITLNVRSH